MRKEKEIAGKKAVSNLRSDVTVLLCPLFKHFLISVTHSPTARYILQSTYIIHFFHLHCFEIAESHLTLRCENLRGIASRGGKTNNIKYKTIKTKGT